MSDNPTKFKRLIERDPSVRLEMQELARSYDGDRDDDRAVFDAVVAPVARSCGMPFTYEEAMDAMAGVTRELSDDDLDMVAGGVGVWHRVVSGALVTTMVFGAVPTVAMAGGAPAGSTPSVVREYAGGDLFAGDGETDGGAGMGSVEDALSGYSADFSNDDIVTPEDVEATDDGLVVTDFAVVDATAATLLSDAPKKSAPGPAGQNDWDRTGKAIDYTRDALGYVSKDAATAAGYGKALFDFIKAGCIGDYSAAFGGGVELLKLTGILHRDSDVSNKEVLKEVKELRILVEGMSEQLDETSKQAYQNRLVVFDNAVGTLDIDCTTAEAMLAKAAKIADERGEGLAGGVQRPERPAVDELVLPEEPPSTSGVPEPTHPDVPDRPVEPAEPYQASTSGFVDLGRLSREQKVYKEAYAQWQEDAAAWDAEYGDIWAEYQQEMAEWDGQEAVVRQAHADWEEECARLRQEHDRQVAEADAWDEEAAVAEWEAAQDADANAYMQRLVHIMEEEEKAGNKDFKNFSKTMDAIERNFKLVAVECAKSEGSSPFHAFDSYWAMHFNFDTQGYYLRQAYRTSAEFQLRRSYALLASYYDMASYSGGEDDTDPRESLTTALTSALNGIEALPAGNSPDDLLGAAFVTRGFYLKRNVYSYTLGRSFNLTMFRSSLASVGVGDHYTEGQIKAYCSRLHGRTVAEDLRLAGVMLEYDSNYSNWNNWLAERGGNMSPQNYLGLGVNHEVAGDRWITRYVPFDAKGYQLREYDEDNHHGVIFLINN